MCVVYDVWEYVCTCICGEWCMWYVYFMCVCMWGEWCGVCVYVYVCVHSVCDRDVLGCNQK